jgi:hypothetical protein
MQEDLTYIGDQLAQSKIDDISVTQPDIAAVAQKTEVFSAAAHHSEVFSAAAEGAQDGCDNAGFDVAEAAAVAAAEDIGAFTAAAGEAVVASVVAGCR